MIIIDLLLAMGVTNTLSTVYVFYKSYATITLKIDKQNGMTVYKNY